MSKWLEQWAEYERDCWKAAGLKDENARLARHEELIARCQELRAHPDAPREPATSPIEQKLIEIFALVVRGTGNKDRDSRWMRWIDFNGDMIGEMPASDHNTGLAKLAADLQWELDRAVAEKAAGTIGKTVDPRAAIGEKQKFETEDEIPKEYRDHERKSGKPLTASYVARPETHNLSSSYLSREMRKPGGGITGRVRFGRTFVYLHREIAALSAKKNSNA